MHRSLLLVALAMCLCAAARAATEGGPVAVFIEVDTFLNDTRTPVLSTSSFLSNSSCSASILGGCHTLIADAGTGGCTITTQIADGEFVCSGTGACTLNDTCTVQYDGDEDLSDALALGLDVNLFDLGNAVEVQLTSDVATTVTVTLYDQDLGVASASAVVVPGNVTNVLVFDFDVDFVGAIDLELIGAIELSVSGSGGADSVVDSFHIIRYEQPGIGGGVFIDCNCDNIFDDIETPLAGVPVSLSGCGLNLVTATSALGLYRFPDLAPCDYVVSVEPLDVGGLCDNSAEVRTVSLGTDVGATVNFGSSQGTGCEPILSTITGTVFFDEFCDGEDAGRFNLGAEGIDVTIVGDADCALSSATTTTDEFGHYSFFNLTECDYTVTVDESVRLLCPLETNDVVFSLLPDSLVTVDFALRAPIPFTLDDFLNPILDNETDITIGGLVQTSRSVRICDPSFDSVFSGCHRLELTGFAFVSEPSASVRNGRLYISSPGASEAGAVLELGGDDEAFHVNNATSDDFNTLGTTFRVVAEVSQVTLVRVEVDIGNDTFFLEQNFTRLYEAEYLFPFSSFVSINPNDTQVPTFQDVKSVRLFIEQLSGHDLTVSFFGLISELGSVVGSTFVDCDCDGRPSESEEVLSGVEVTLSGCAFTETTTTNSDGLFVFINLQPCASYAVSVPSSAIDPLCEGAAGATQFVEVTDESVDVFFGSGDRSNCPVEPARIIGRVLFEEECNGVETTPVGGVTVDLVGSGSAECDAISQSDVSLDETGQYSFDDLPICTYTLSLRPHVGIHVNDHVPCQNKPSELTVTPAEGEVVSDVDFSLRDPLLVRTIVDDFLAEVDVFVDLFIPSEYDSTSCDANTGGTAGAIIGGCHTAIMIGTASQACHPTATAIDGVFSCSNGRVCTADCRLQLDGDTTSPLLDLGLGGFDLASVGTGFRVSINSDHETPITFNVFDTSGVRSHGTFTVPSTNGEFLRFDSFFKDYIGAADLNSVGTIELLVPGQRSLDVLFRDWNIIVPAADITGIAFGDCNCDSDQDEFEVVAAGVEVRLQGCGEDRTTFTDADGRYFFLNLLPCDYEVSVDSVDSIVGFCQDPVQVVSVFGELVEHNIPLECFGTITGFTYGDRDCRGVREIGSGIGGVTVTATGAEEHCPGSREGVSNSDGSFSIGSLVPCTYVVSVPSDSTSLCPDQPKSQVAILPSGAVLEDVDFRFSPHANIIGTVVSSSVCDASVTSNPLPGVQLTLTGVERCPITVTTTTTATGDYAFSRLAPCTYTVSVSTVGGQSCPLKPLHTEIVLLPGVTVTDIDFVFLSHTASLGSISGAVLQDDLCDGNFTSSFDGAYGGVLVSLFGEEECPELLRTAVSQSNGSYSFDGIPPCTYTVTVPTSTATICPGGATARRVILPSAGDLDNIDFVFSSRAAAVDSGSILGRVIGDVGCDGNIDVIDRGLENIRINLIPGADCEVAEFTHAFTDSTGTYRFDDVEACEYTVTEVGAGNLCPGETSSRGVIVGSGDVLNVDFRVALVVNFCSGVICDDNDRCTVDACDPLTGECVFEEIPSCGRPPLCDNVACDDQNSCTIDQCNEETGYCDSVFGDSCGPRQTGVVLDDVFTRCAAGESVYTYRVKLFGGDVPQRLSLCLDDDQFVGVSDMVDVETGDIVCEASSRVRTDSELGFRGVRWEDCSSDAVGREVQFDVVVNGFYSASLGTIDDILGVLRSSTNEFERVVGPFDCDCDSSFSVASVTDSVCTDYGDNERCRASALLEVSVTVEEDRRRQHRDPLTAEEKRQLEDLLAALLGISRYDIQIETNYFRVSEFVVVIRLFDTAERSSSQLAADLTVAVSSNDPVLILSAVEDGVVNIVSLPNVVQGEFTFSAGARHTVSVLGVVVIAMLLAWLL